MTNNYVLTEVRVVLRRIEFSLTDKEVTDLVRYLHECLTVIEDLPDEEILSNFDFLRDKKDLPVALGAKVSNSDYLVTGDKELLENSIAQSISTSKLLQQLLSDLSGTAPRRRVPKIK